MAVYGRSKERWIPTKIKSKVSKNNTYELNGTTSKVLFWMNIDEKVGDNFVGPVGEFSGELTSIPLSGYGDFTPQIESVRAAHFKPKGLHFDKNGTQRSYIQTGENELGITPNDIGGTTRTHDTWVSFWVKTYQDNFNGSKGHNIGGLYRAITNSAVEPNPGPTQPSDIQALDPFVLFGLSSSGAPILRFHRSGQAIRIYYVGDVDNSKNVEPNEWSLVTWLIKVPVKEDQNPDWLYSSMVQLWIDGVEVDVSALNQNDQVPDSTDTSLWDTAQLELILGNQTVGYEADNKLGPGEGFWGSLAEFLIFTQPEGDVTSRTQMAKFLYEAQREGAYHLHSGIHNSSPRLEQLDLDRDSAYPPTTSLPAYSVIAKETAEPQTLQRSTSRFFEGVLSDPYLSLDDTSIPGPVEAWSEKASKWYKPSTTVLPHLRLDPSDTILTQGEWYSDARSEFFSEDLDPTTGFLVPDASSDELYREHPQVTSIAPFRDLSETGETFKDTRVIEIPLVNLAEMVLTTDSAGEVSQLRSTYNGSSLDAVVQTDPAQAINTMAYYNFDNQQWEATTPSWSTYAAAPGNPAWVEDADIGFSPMTGLVIPRQIDQLEAVLDSYGRPMSDFGFPFHDKFAASDGQTIDLSKYIDEEVILEGWEISTPVIPVVGYQQDTSGVQDNTAGGPSGFWPALDSGGGRSAFYYGAHGEACQIWNESREPNPFIDRQVSLRTGSQYGYNNTIPVSNPEEGNGSSFEPYKPYYNSPGFVTKGVTAFLMKQKTSTKTTQSKMDKWRSENHHHNFSSNSGPFGSYTTTPSVKILGEQLDASESDGWPQYYTQPFESLSDFESTTERELIGYLQHLYHNDPQPERLRTTWTRYIPEWGSWRLADPNVAGVYKAYYDGVEPLGWPALSLVEKLGCENQTYVPNLLRENHADLNEYAFHVKGSLKQVTPFAGAVPITAFKVVSVRDIPFDNTTQPNPGFIDKINAVNREYFVSQGVVPSNQGHIPSGLVNYDSFPSVTGKPSGTGILVPELCAPITGSGAYIDGSGVLQEYSWAGEDLVALTRKLQVVQNPDPDGDVILRPTDKLVLGIQDSVSTTIGGQQSIYNGDENGFIRWGRNTLRIPETKSGYLRLYVRKTREDKPFNQVADQNQYNQNVNRDLGDHDIDDRFFISDPITYSGSMADDIIGPTTFTPPVMRTEVTWNHSNESILKQYNWGPGIGGGSFWNAARDTGTGISNGYFEVRPDFGGDLTIDGNHLPVNWASCSDLVFKDRGQTTLPRRPAVEWKDPAGYDKQNDGSPANHWQNIYEALHWSITEQNPLAAAENYAHNALGSPAGNSRVIPFRPLPMAYMQELCPNDGAPSSNIANVTIASTSVDQTLVGDDSPALSAWNFRVLLPMFIRSSVYNFLGAGVSALGVEFRLVKIDSRAESDTMTINSVSHPVAGKRPTIDGVELKLGDAFYFDNNNNPVLLSLDKTSLMSTLGGEANQAVDSDQRWARKAAFLRSDGMIRIFIVAGEVEYLNIGYVYPRGFYQPLPNTTITGQKGFLNNSEVFAIVSRILDIQCSIDESLLGGVTNPWDGTTLLPGDTNNYVTPQGVEVLRPDTSGFTSFSLDLPQDTDIRGQFQTYEEAINDTIDFKLCGLSLRGLTNDYPTTAFTNADRNSQLDPLNPGFIRTSLHDALYLYDPDGTITWVPSHDMANLIGDGMLHPDNVTQIDSYWFGDYFKAIVDTTVETESSIFFEDPVYGTGEADIGGIHQTNAMYRISYRGLETAAPQLKIVAETYNETVGRRIDRFVQRRSTSTLINNDEESGPLRAGPFGSLRKTIKLNSESVFFDSLAPSSLVKTSTGYCSSFEHGTKTECEAAHQDFWVDTDYVTTLADIPNHFPLENGEDKSEILTKGVRVKMLLSPDGDGPSLSNTETLAISNDPKYKNMGNFTWGNISFPANIFDEGGKGLLNLTNYIQKDFKGNSDFTRKTVRDYFLGFGDAPAGKLTIRPAIREYYSFTQSTPERFSTEWVLDPPRGSRFGIMNTSESSPSYHFSYSHFGHMRDMLEQGLDSKKSGAAFNQEILGPPVVINAINPTNPEVPKLMENTSRFNKTAHATVVKPYIEDNYESIVNPVNLNSESLRVDVAGSIRSRQILAPGNVASNIRRR